MGIVTEVSGYFGNIFFSILVLLEGLVLQTQLPTILTQTLVYRRLHNKHADLQDHSLENTAFKGLSTPW